MKFISWNVNGLRACMNKGFLDTFYALNADFFCLQETKLQEGQINLDLPGYEQYWCYAEKKGYSGTAIFTKHTPLSVSYGLDVEELDNEGRLITLEYQEFYLVTCYTPNAQRGLARIDHRLRWEEAFRNYLKELDSKKPVILCGDLNVAHKEIDLKNPSSNRGNAGFSDEERNAFTQLLNSGFTDTFRLLYPDTTGAYSWWSYMYNARQNNAGWRIDYFVVSNRLNETIFDATIHPDVMGSDHCPVGLDLNISCNGGIWSPNATRQEETDVKEADGESSVGKNIPVPQTDAPKGVVRTVITVAITAIVTAALMMPFVLHRPSSEPEPTTAQERETKPRYWAESLITNIVDRSSSIEFNSIRLSSVEYQYFTNGEKNWHMLSPALDFSSFSNHVPNFFLQVSFPKDVPFTETDLPQVETRHHYEGPYMYTPYVTHRFYYGENGNITGCFVCGYLPEESTVDITVSYGSLTTTAPDVAVKPDIRNIDYSTSNTAKLIYLLSISDGLNALVPSFSELVSSDYRPVTFTLDDCIDKDPLIIEVLSRDDGIQWMLDSYELYPRIMGLLLDHPKFYDRMTPDEQTRYEELKENAPLLYG